MNPTEPIKNAAAANCCRPDAADPPCEDQPIDASSANLPAHVAVIMDGNGRWARKRGFPRIEGHRRGVASVRKIVEESSRLG
ncbi:MAG: undecaprenyl diphosphate synthase family protein, partial [Planctomycetales bacterium]